MSFWLLSSGALPSGESKDAFSGNFGIIPDGTTALASIQKFILDESGKFPIFNITWKIVDGDYKGRVVFQKIHAFDEKPSKSDRAKNMLMLIFKLVDYKPSHDNVPNNDDLCPMQGKILGIKIQEYCTNDGKQGNYVSEVHPTKDFIQQRGIK